MREASPLWRSTSTSARVPSPASTPIPASSSSRLSSAAPSSMKLTETKSGVTRHADTSRSRSAPPAIQAPVVSPSGIAGQAARTASTTAATASGSSVSAPLPSRWWR